MFNRDEQRDRPEAIPPRWREVTAAGGGVVRAIWPSHPRGGGTWIGACESGPAVCPVNRNKDEVPEQLQRGSLSRGLIIPRAIASLSPWAVVEAIGRLELDRFAPFRVLAAQSGESGVVLMEAEWDGDSFSAREVAGMPVCPASSGLGDSRVADRLRLFGDAVPAVGAGESDQDQFHAHVWPARPEVSVLISSADARTVSVTTLSVCRDANGVHVRMDYRPIPEAVGPRLGRYMGHA